MSAHDWLQQAQFGPLFHGTRAELEPGDVITPRTKKVAHASPHAATARVFAGGTKAVRAGEGHVYEVEPLDQEQTWSQQMKYTGRETHYETVSTAGFRVKRRLPKSHR